MMQHQFIQLVSVQFKEFFREPGILFWAMAFPILMAWGLGLAFTEKGALVKKVAVVSEVGKDNQQLQQFLSDAIPKPESEASIKTFDQGDLGQLTFEFHYLTMEEAIVGMKRGKMALILVEQPNELEYQFDPLNPEAQLTYLQLTDVLDGKTTASQGAVIKPMTQTGTRYIDFLIPGLMAMGIMMSSMWGVSYTMIDKRSKKLLRRMVATPMGKTYFLLSHLVSRIAISAVEATLLLVFSWLTFDIAIEGSFLGVILIFLSGNLAFTGLAILISTRTDVTQVGNGLINAVVMPMMIMSGIFFSYHNFPDWVIAVIQFFPLTVMADGFRSIFTEGAGLEQTVIPVVALTAFGLLCFGLGRRFFKWY